VNGFGMMPSLPTSPTFSEPVSIAVNLSPAQFKGRNLVQVALNALASTALQPNRLDLEITETVFLQDEANTLATLHQLRDIGVRISMDDFGTGYSSLAYLKRLPVDELKIDKSFVLGMQSDADDAQIVRSTIDLAHNLGLSVVAEGVENAAVWDLLRELNCDQAQGFHMGRPMAAADFAQWSTVWLSRQRGSGPESRLMLH